MSRKSIKSVILSFMLIVSILVSPLSRSSVSASTRGVSIIILSHYSATISIGEDLKLTAVSTPGDKITFKSSNSSIASVDAKGYITGKKPGSCRIIAKNKKTEACCKITVAKTIVTLSKSSVSMENGASVKLSVSSSTGHEVKWKTNRKSVAAVDSTGLVTACKPGNADITATVDGTSAVCHITVKSPTVKIYPSSLNMYRTQQFHISATVSSGRPVTWKSNRSSIVSVDSDGLITAMKHGTAIITATVDGVSKTCMVTVEQPKISLSESSLTIKAGKTHRLTAIVSSGISPKWSSSNMNVASVDQKGQIIARQKGKAYIYASEDGVKVSCIVTVK